MIQRIEREDIKYDKLVLLSRIDEAQNWLRSSFDGKRFDAIEYFVGTLIVFSFKLLLHKWLISSDDVEKNNWRFIFGISDVDTMMSYMEDFFGWDWIDECVINYYEKYDNMSKGEKEKE